MNWLNKLLKKEYTINKKYENSDPKGPINFGIKIWWIAVKASNVNDILKLDYIRDKGLVNWAQGMSKASENGIFLLPSINGWCLIVGYGLPTPDHQDGVKKCKDILSKLSRDLSEAYLFGNHRVSESAFWMTSVNGEVLRLYCVADGQTTIIGKPSGSESNWDLFDSNSARANEGKYWDESLYPGEEEVLQLAEKWSINPLKLTDFKNVDSTGHIIQLK